MVSIFLRSLVYNVLFYLLLIFWLIVAIPTFLLPRWGILTIARWWAVSSISLMRVVCNTRVEYRGLETIPKGPLIVASKHQSMSSSVANSVRRDAKAVIAAINIACAASAI